MSSKRSTTVRFFIDRVSGLPCEVKLHTMFVSGDELQTVDGVSLSQVLVWFTCTCEEFEESNWCAHADAVDADFDPETATLYGDVDDEFDGTKVLSGDTDADERFRNHLLAHSRIDVL